jgi:uncharacterized LabA/DUF88 family protein
MPASFHQRVGVFIDVQNMFYATKNLYGSKLNYSKLLDYIARGRDLVRSVAYVVQTPEIDQSNFLTMLRSNGYEVRSKELKQRPDGSCKGDWDMGLALDALSMAERLDVVAIVSGDGDFSDLVAFLKARGVRVEVYSFPYSTAEELRTSATEFYQMGPEIVMNPNRAFANFEGREARPYREDEYPEPYREGQPPRESYPRPASVYPRPAYPRPASYGRDAYGREPYPREGYRDEYRGQYRDEYREPYADEDLAPHAESEHEHEVEAEAPEAVASDQE